MLWFLRKLLLLGLILLCDFCVFGQYQLFDMPVSICYGKVVIFPEDQKALVRNAGIKLVTIRELTMYKNRVDTSYPQYTIGCAKNGETHLIDENFSMAMFSRIVYDIDTNIIAIETSKSQDIGCSQGGHTIVLEHFYVRNIYEHNQLKHSFTKRSLIRPNVVMDTDQNEVLIKNYFYNSNGHLSRETKRVANTQVLTAKNEEVIQYVYDSKGRLSQSVSLNNVDTMAFADIINTIPTDLAALVVRQLPDWHDSLVARDFHQIIEDTSEESESLLDAAIAKRDSSDKEKLGWYRKMVKGSTSYSYNKKGLPVKRVVIANEYRLQHAVIDTFIYDKQNRLISWNATDYYGEQREWQFIYDEQGRVCRCNYCFYRVGNTKSLLPDSTQIGRKSYVLTYTRNNLFNTIKLIKQNVSDTSEYNFVVSYEKYL